MQQPQERKYREIRPAELPVESTDGNDNKGLNASPADASSSSLQPRRKRSAVSVACDRCRARKIAVSSNASLKEQPGRA